MQIAIRKIDNLAVMIFNDDEILNITETILEAPNLIVSDINLSTHEIVSGNKPEKPLYFVANAFTYKNGIWELIDQNIYNLFINAIIESEKRENDIKAKYIREQRNKLLEECDWTQLTDSAVKNNELWKLYRSKLRDITLQEGFPCNINWPEKP